MTTTNNQEKKMNLSISSMFVLAALLTTQVTKAQEKKPTMRVMTPAAMPSAVGPVETFTGSVKVIMIVDGEKPSNLSSAHVSFEPGARAAWHTHPGGQLLVVNEGSGLIQEKGKPIKRIKKGDVVWTPPGVKHWHGAAPDSAMSHIATQEGVNGKVVEWMEKVTDLEYNAIAK